MKNKAPKSKGNFVMEFANGRKISFRTHQAMANACEVISTERFTNVAQMVDRVKLLPTGFEGIQYEGKVKEYRKSFNAIEFED